MQLSTARLAQRNSIPFASETFARRFAEHNADSRAQLAASEGAFLVFVSEMGRQNEIITHTFASPASANCATPKIILAERRLVQLACFLRCVALDAAMHNRKHGTTIGSAFAIEQRCTMQISVRPAF